MSETTDKQKAQIAKDAKDNSKAMQMALLGSGDNGLKTLTMMLYQTKVFTPDLKPEEMGTRNAGIKLILTMLGGVNPDSGKKLAQAFIKGLGAVYEDFKEDIHRDSLNKDTEENN